MSPAFNGVLGSSSRVLLIALSVIGIFICRPDKPVHKDLGRVNIFWKMILFATKDPSNAVKAMPSSTIFLSVICSPSPFLTDDGGSFPLVR